MTSDPVRDDLAGLTEAEQFQRGWQHGIDPTNTGTDGPALTTVTSFWAAGSDRMCPVCRHTFRIGDRVLVRHARGATPARVVHESQELPCSGQDVQTQTDDPELADQFFAAVDTCNPLRAVAVRLKATSPQVANRRMRSKCAGCGDTVRPLEVVVFCPCDEENPRCRLPVHHDPARGLDCHDEWLSGKTLKHCPMSYRKRG